MSQPESSQAIKRIDKGKGIATKDQPDVQPKLVKASSIDRINKVAEEGRLFEMNKPEVIKVVHEEAKNIGINPKTIISAKAGTMTKRNFEVHNPFRFADFRLTELDELGPIIGKKKNSIVKDLMASFSKRYERLKKIPKELGIQSALLTPLQAQSQSSGRNRKHMELEPKIKVHGLKCNKSLPEGVPFVNNMVIEELEYGIFFIDVFGDQAFQRWNDIHKVLPEAQENNIMEMVS
ncbi:hypothetical protein Tco_1507919 [Tanacetum coccineum]